MPVQNFKPVTWTNEPISQSKLADMSSNSQWLYENMPKVQYYAQGLQRNDGVKILAGMILIAASGQKVYGNVAYFGDFFTPGSVPVITLGALPGPGMWEVTCWHQGIHQWLPDHRGVELYAAHPTALTKDIWIAYHAIGV